MFSPHEFIYSKAYVDYKLALAKHTGYTPGAGQLEAHKRFERFLVICGGARWGKSMFAGFEDFVQLTLPGQRIWQVGPQYTLAEKEFNWVVEFLSRTCLKQLGGANLLSQCKVSISSRGSQRIETAWGSWLETKTAEKPASLFGESLTKVTLCEAAHIKKNIWDRILRARLGDLNGRMVATSTPDKSSGLLYHMNNRGLNDEFEDWKSFSFGVADNPTFSRKELEIAKKELPPKIFAQQYGGEFLDPREKVIETFFENEVVCEEMPASVFHLPTFITIKRAYNNPSALLILAVDRKNRLVYVLGEIYNSKTRLRDIEEDIKRWTVGRRFAGFITDFQDHNVQNEIRSMNYNYMEVAPDKSKTSEEIDRINTLRDFFRDEYIQIDRSCTSLVDDIENYRYDDVDEDDDKKQKEVPSKSIHKQGVDALANAMTLLRRTTGGAFK